MSFLVFYFGLLTNQTGIMSTPPKKPKKAKPHYRVRKVADTQFVEINNKVFIPESNGVTVLTKAQTHTRFINNSWYE